MCYTLNINKTVAFRSQIGLTMDIKYIKELNSAVHEFFNSNGFSSQGLDTGFYKSEDKIYTISYEDDAKLFVLSSAAIITDSKDANYSTLSTWYFDEANHGAKDIQCIADDFIGTVAKMEGIRIISSGVTDTSNITLPEKKKDGDEPGIEAFAGKFLALFPQYKDAYKEMIATYGDFLYVEFFKTYAVEKLCELKADEAKNKKQLKKYFDMLGQMHYDGESIVGDVICSVIFAGAFKGNTAEYLELANVYLTDWQFLKSAGLAAVNNYRSDKKLRELLG